MDWYGSADKDRLRKVVDLLLEPPTHDTDRESLALSIARENQGPVATVFSHFLDWEELDSGSLERKGMNIEDEELLESFVRALWDVDRIVQSLAMLPPDLRFRQLAEHASRYGFQGHQLAQLERWRIGPARNLMSALKENNK